MQLVTVLSATAAMVGSASAIDAAGFKTTSQLMKTFDASQPSARVVNRCPYDVYIWSVLKTDGCSSDNMVVLKTGETYTENLQSPVNKVGVSIKISKSNQCKGVDITQLEYYLETDKQYANNFLDVSYVDCLGGKCPTMQEGYYLKAGSQSGEPSKLGYATTSANNGKICPVISCYDQASCSKISYVLPDDVQTRSCGLDQNLEFYMCGGEAPSANDSNPKPAPSAQQPSSQQPSSQQPAAKPSPSKASEEPLKVNAAAVTPKPQVNEPVHVPNVKTEMVYVTEYKYVNAKRHAHGHARRHQNFHA